MSNPIRSYSQTPLQAYGPAPQPPTPASGARPAQTAEPAQPARPAAPQAEARSLSAAEQQMIDRFFPAEPRMTLKLYGPGRGAHTVDPTALGTRLDLSG